MTDEELKALFKANADAMHQRFEQIDARFGQIDARLDETNRRIETSSVDLRRHFDLTLERLGDRFDSLAEATALLDEKLDRRTNSIEEEMRRGFADTHAMIKFSHAELDQRLRVLEDEKSTH